MKDWKNYTTKAEPIGKALKYRDDYIGQRFGNLVVIGYPVDRYGIRGGGAVCVCDCGNRRNVDTVYELISGFVSRCSECGRKLRNEKGKTNLDKLHEARKGKYYEYNKERLYRVWIGMLQRGKTTHGAYADVSVCDEWRDYLVFREWAYSHGYDDEAPRMQCTIDRINPFGDYEPGNCRFADTKTQARNKRKRWLNLDEEQRAALLMESTPTN